MSGGADADWMAALSARAEEAEAALDAALPLPPGPERRVVEAMRYAALGGGKRLRAFLALESAALFDAPVSAARRIAASVECAHAYSLVHDDLPAMDDDDLRRGRPTTHLAFDDATAILAGDALQTRAFGLLAEAGMDAAPAAKAALVVGLAEAIGDAGMVAGQMIDLMAEGRIAMGAQAEAARIADLDGVTRLQALKTGALIRFSAVSGALLAEQDPAPLTDYAERLGLAFQIRDDLLDVEGDETAAGKRLRKDAAAGKATFIDLLGVDGAKARAHALAEEAVAALTPYGDRAARLAGAADFAVSRKT